MFGVFVWKNSDVMPSFEAAVALARALDLSLDYLGGINQKKKVNPLLVLFKAKLPKLNKKQIAAVRAVLEAF